MSDTPRVDGLRQAVSKHNVEPGKAYHEALNLAKRLEIELATAHKRIAELEQVSAADAKDALADLKLHSARSVMANANQEVNAFLSEYAEGNGPDESGLLMALAEMQNWLASDSSEANPRHKRIQTMAKGVQS